MEWEDRVINEVYGGDRQRYEREYPTLLQEANADAVSWNDLIRSATVLDQFEQQAKDCIEDFLGYLPDSSTTIRYEPFLRSLIQQKTSGQIAGDQFEKLAEEHIRLIRNEDVRFNVAAEYDQELYDTYHREYLPYGAIVRQRITGMLGYEPELSHSLLSELYLRQVMSNDRIALPNSITCVDYKVLTLVRYREVLLSEGKLAADSSPLFKSQQPKTT